VVICLERCVDLRMAQLMPLPLTVSCFSKIQIGFTFLVPADPGSPGKGPLKECVCVCCCCGARVDCRVQPGDVQVRCAASAVDHFLLAQLPARLPCQHRLRPLLVRRRRQPHRSAAISRVRPRSRRRRRLVVVVVPALGWSTVVRVRTNARRLYISSLWMQVSVAEWLARLTAV